MTERSGPPTITVTSGDPTPQELAVVIALVTARATAQPEAPAAPVSQWRRAALASVRPVVVPGPGAWAAAARTR